MIGKRDHKILRAFLHREADMYNWWPKEGDRERRQAFINSCFKQITEAFPGEGFNYISIESITNMGLVDSKLVLSAEPFSISGGNVVCLLPPAASGSVHIRKVET